MFRRLSIAFLVALFAVSIAPSGVGRAQTSTPDSYIVVFSTPGALSANAGLTIARAGGRMVDALPQMGVAIAESSDPAFVARLSRAPGIQRVGANLLLQWIPATPAAHLHAPEAPRLEGHDPAAAAFFALQWNMRAIDAHGAWAAGATGHPAVTVAVLDTGIDPTHVDLAGRVDAARSASFVSNIPDLPECSDPDLIDTHFPGAPEWVDLNLHGTHVAGIVAANGLGVAGVAPHVTLMAVKVLNACGSGTVGGVLQGILHAADEGADVINVSLGLGLPASCRDPEMAPGERGELRNACAAIHSAFNRATSYAHRQGSLVISSAGNNAVNANTLRDIIIIPAQSTNVMGVSATGPIAAGGVEPDTVASYTNYGNGLIDVAAPGGDFRRFPVGDWFVDMVLSPCSRFSLEVPDCQTGHFFLWVAGTSVASPHVAGLAALIASEAPGALSPSQIRTRIQNSADDLGKPGYDPFYGHGRINALRAVQ